MQKTIDNWILTDGDTNQYRKKINETTFLFKEDRIENPETGKKEVYESEINISEYSSEQIKEAVTPFGYDYLENNLLEGFSKEESIMLIAECLFEMET